jgi:phosphotransferase system HPr-like phosphotransfer protein
MMEVSILLDTVDKVKGFVNLVGPMDGDMDIVSERYRIDAKSIMGIFSLDLTKPIQLVIHSEATAARLLPQLQPFTAS